MARPSFSQVNVQPGAPQLLAQEGGGPQLVFTAAPAVTVYLTDDKFNTDTTDATAVAALPALATVVLDGEQNVYGLTRSGTALCTIIPGGLSFFQLVEVLVKTLLIAASAGNGLFVYSGAPALGDLIASIVAAGTTKDQF